MENAITVKIILEIVGAPKEHVEETLNQVIDKLTKEEGVEIVNKHIEGSKPLKNKFFSTFADLEVKVKDNNKLLSICFDYMPSSIEIMEPQKLDLSMGEMTDILNDLLARLHKYDMLVRNIHAENIVLKKELGKDNKEEKKD